MARTDPQLNFRCPQELKDKLEKAASENKRSLTSELINRLELSFYETSEQGLIKTLDEHLEYMAEQNEVLLQEVRLLRQKK